jgi:hypothetical protein
MLLSNIKSTLIAHNYRHAVVPLIIGSYPSGLGSCRQINYPDLDMYYAVCQLANVECRHVYMHRDPHAIVHSTLWKRHFNQGVGDSLQIYTSMLQVIYTHMSVHSENLMGCLDLLPSEPTKDFEDHDSNQTNRSSTLAPFFAWSSSDLTGFEITLRNIMKPTVPTRERDDIVPPEFHVYLQSMQEAQRAIWQHCAARLAHLSPKPSTVEATRFRNEGITFIFFMGLNGSGHDWVGSKLRESSSAFFVNRLGLRGIIRDLQDALYSNSGLFYTHCKYESELLLTDARLEATNSTISTLVRVTDGLGADATFERVVKLFRKVQGKIGSEAAVNIPINADGYIENQGSYPQDEDSCQFRKYPNIDLLYAACLHANVECRHIYISSTSTDLVASPSHNTDSRSSRYLLKTLLDIMFAQNALHPSRTMACLDVPLYLNSSRDTSWQQALGDYFGSSVDAPIPAAPEESSPRLDSQKSLVDMSLQLLQSSRARTGEICRQVVKSSR